MIIYMHIHMDEMRTIKIAFECEAGGLFFLYAELNISG